MGPLFSMNSYITVGLGFGDEGKGSVVDALVREHRASLVVRYNGGAQAAHNVITPEGLHHTFRQLGSGSFVKDVKTLLSRHMLVNPLTLEMEAEDFADIVKCSRDLILRRVYVDSRALITTPYHRALNRLRECERGKSFHGSCGMGIGETMRDYLEREDDMLRVGDLRDKPTLIVKLMRTYEAMHQKVKSLNLSDGNNPIIKRELSTFQVHQGQIINRYIDLAEKIQIIDPADVQKLFLETDTAVFEGAQGVLLDAEKGFHPYTTWSNTTTANALSILKEHGHGQHYTEIGVMRSYATRHGPGPFPTEISHGFASELVRNEHNTFSTWQKDFRVGWLDLAMLRYALSANGGVEKLAITHVDAAELYSREWPVCMAYKNFLPCPKGNLEDQEDLTAAMFKVEPELAHIPTNSVVKLIESQHNIPVILTSHGPTCLDKQFCREEVYS
jgi:adenylosuccinate synthase